MISFIKWLMVYNIKLSFILHPSSYILQKYVCSIICLFLHKPYVVAFDQIYSIPPFHDKFCSFVLRACLVRKYDSLLCRLINISQLVTDLLHWKMSKYVESWAIKQYFHHQLHFCYFDCQSNNCFLITKNNINLTQLVFNNIFW